MNWEKRSDMHAKGICKLIADWSCFRDPALKAFLKHLRWRVAQHHASLFVWGEGSEGGEVK